MRKIILIYLAALLVGTVACNKDDKKQNNTIAVGPGISQLYGQGCTNCFPNPYILMPGLHSVDYGNNGPMTLDILVPTGAPVGNQYSQYGTHPVKTYQGQVALQGAINISTQSYTYCGVLPGTYEIRTTTVGNMSNGMINGLALLATGPGGSIQMNVSNATIYNSSDFTMMSGDTRIGLNMQVIANGMPCGSVSTY